MSSLCDRVALAALMVIQILVEEEGNAAGSGCSEGELISLC